jgi:zinc transport system permease protein
MNELVSLLDYQFIRNALIAGALASIVCGIIGVMIAEKKCVMLTGGIAHTSYGGVGLGYFLGFEPVIGAFLFAVGAALGIGYIKRSGTLRSDVITGLFWSTGMALGILFISLMPGYPPELSSYLFGSILAVTKADILFMSGLTIVVVLSVAGFFEYWKMFLFDQEFSHVRGIRTALMEYLLYILIALSVVVLIRVAGIILILALFTAPNAIASLFTRRIAPRMMLSAAVGLFLCFAGLVISYKLNLPSGAAIVILSAGSFLLIYAANLLITRFSR